MGAQERNDPEPARASALSWREGHGWGRTSFAAASDGPVSAELRATGHDAARRARAPRGRGSPAPASRTTAASRAAGLPSSCG